MADITGSCELTVLENVEASTVTFTFFTPKCSNNEILYSINSYSTAQHSYAAQIFLLIKSHHWTPC